MGGGGTEAIGKAGESCRAQQLSLHGKGDLRAAEKTQPRPTLRRLRAARQYLLRGLLSLALSLAANGLLAKACAYPGAAGKRPREGDGKPQTEERLFLPSCLKK